MGNKGNIFKAIGFGLSVATYIVGNIIDRHDREELKTEILDEIKKNEKTEKE